MKPGGSSLNPYATAYVPISKREPEPESIHSKNQLEKCGQAVLSTENQFSFLSSHDGPSQNVNKMEEEQVIDEQHDMTLDYLKMEFPGLCEESIAVVYSANKMDMEATFDMLLQLEGAESSESLPDTLDIGDVPESSLSAQFTSSKQKNVTMASEGSSDSPSSSQVVS